MAKPKSRSRWDGVVDEGARRLDKTARMTTRMKDDARVKEVDAV